MIKLINVSFGALLGNYQEQWNRKKPFQLSLLIILHQSILKRQLYTVVRRIGQISMPL